MIRIRREEADDHRAIAAVHEAAFPTHAEAHLVDALRAAGRLTLSLVAVEEERIVGHVAFSPVSLAGATGGVGLAPLAVLPSHQRLGIGARLVLEGVVFCGLSGVAFVVVLGEPGYYRRFGFKRASEWGLRDEYGGGAAFQVAVGRPDLLPEGGGLVRYAPEFALVDGANE